VQVVVTGAGSALGQALLREIVARAALVRTDGQATAVARVIAVDRTQPAALFLDRRIEYVRGDYEQPRFLARMMGASTDSVFHLSVLGAGLGSAATPADLDVALLRSFDATRALLEACRYQRVPPRMVLASTMEAKLQTGPWPQTTDGVCAALCELLVVESARRRIVQARCVRLPCVVGNGSCREDRALQALLADVAAGRAPPEAAQATTQSAIALPSEAAGALVDAHECTAKSPEEPEIIEIAGRRARIAELAACGATAQPPGS